MKNGDDDDDKYGKTPTDPTTAWRVSMWNARARQYDAARRGETPPREHRRDMRRRGGRWRDTVVVASGLTIALLTVVALGFLGAWLANAHYNGLHCATICCPK